MPPLSLVPLPASGPEDVALDGRGHLYTGTEDGTIHRITLATGSVDVVASTGGRPLGIEMLGDDALLVCDAYKGLLRVALATGDVQSLCTEVGGRPLLLCDNAAAAADGSIYFSDSSERFDLEHYRADLIEHRPTGRLVRVDPDGTATVVVRGLHFANGVAVDEAQGCVLVAETGAYRVTRHWLRGDRAGTTDVFIDNLPGFVDNISTGTDGLIWLALPNPRNPLLDRLLPAAPVIRKAVWALPERLQPQPTRTVWVMAVDASGEVVHDLQMPGVDHAMVTGVREHHGRVYLGSLTEAAVAYFDLDR